MRWLSSLLTLFAIILVSLTLQAQDVPYDAESQKEVDTSDNGNYIYDPTGKKDPFKPYRAPRVRGSSVQAIPIDPLLTVEVGQLEVLGIMWNTAQPRAVVQDAQQRTYTIFKNSRVGRNEGIVADIREGEIVIVEKFDDGLGNIIREAKVLTMRVKTTN